MDKNLSNNINTLTNPNNNKNNNNNNDFPFKKCETTENFTGDFVSGELRKLKSNGVTLFSNTNLRWVELDFKRKIFGYKKTKNDPSLKEYQNLYDFVAYDPETSREHKNKSKWKFGFCVNFKNRNYIFYAESEVEYLKWKSAFTRVTNVFIKYKEINFSVFQIALAKFAKPFLIELEQERLKKIEEDRKNDKAAAAEKEKVKPVEAKVDYALLLGVQGNVLKPKNSDIYSEEFKKEIEEKIQSIEVGEEILMQKNIKDEVFARNKYSISKSNFQFNENDLNDWDFYNEESMKIDVKNLINYNPVLKDQRKSLSPALRSVVKGYLTSNTDNYIENVKTLKTIKKENNNDSINNPEAHQCNRNIKSNTISHKQNISLVMEFANNDLYGTNQSNNKLNFNNNLNIKTFEKDKTENRNQIFSDGEEEFVILNNFNQQNFHANNSAKQIQFKNKNAIDNYVNFNNFNFSENVLVEDFYNLRNLKTFNNVTVKKHDSDINNNFIDERVLLSEIKQKAEEEKLIKIKTLQEINENQIKESFNNLNDFNYSKFSVTKEELLKEINEKDKSKFQKSKSSLYKPQNDFENFEFTISKNAREDISKKENACESFNEVDNNCKNSDDKSNKIYAVEENPNKFVMKIINDNAQFSLDEKDNINFSKSHKKVCLLNKYVEHKATEYVNDNKNKSLNQHYNPHNSKGLNPLNANKGNNWGNDNLNDASAFHKQKLFDNVFGKKQKTLIENKTINFDDSLKKF